MGRDPQTRNIALSSQEPGPVLSGRGDDRGVPTTSLNAAQSFLANGTPAGTHPSPVIRSCSPPAGRRSRTRSAGRPSDRRRPPRRPNEGDFVEQVSKRYRCGRSTKIGLATKRRDEDVHYADAGSWADADVAAGRPQPEKCSAIIGRIVPFALELADRAPLDPEAGHDVTTWFEDRVGGRRVTDDEFTAHSCDAVGGR